MRSFSATGFASDHSDALEHAARLVHKDPQALFSDFQWFLYEARNTVYFTAFSRERMDAEELSRIIAEMVALAPQLTHGFVGARPGQPLPKSLLDAVTSIEEVDDFEGYPDKWLDAGEEIFARKDLPLFRVKAAVRRDGPDEEGRASMILVRSSHALMEGADSALLTRSQSAGHGIMSSSRNRLPLKERLLYAVMGGLMSPLYLIMAHLKSPDVEEMGFKSIPVERSRLRAVANRLGIRQRSLMFALVMHAVNDGGKGLDMRTIAAAYTILDTDRNNADDDFFRVRALDARFPVKSDLVAFARAIDATLDTVEARDVKKTQAILNAMFGMSRRLARILPFLYTRRFYRFGGPYDVVLTLVPPHRTYGNLTHGLMEPIFCGSYHGGSNLCTFVPGRRFVTFNFCMRTNHLRHAEKIERLLADLERG